MRRRVLTAVFGISCSAGLCLLAACSDDDTNTNDAGGVDAAPTETSTGTDSGPKADANNNVIDSGPGTDSGPSPDASEAGADAGPTRTATTMSTGLIRVGDIAAQARFSEDDTVVQWSNAPQCVAIVKSATKPPSTAGTVTVDGQIIGADGGPTDKVELTPPDYYYDGTVLPPTSEFTVDVTEAPGNPAFPALPKQTLRPSLSSSVTITAPLPDAGTGDLPATKGQPMVFTWTVPSGDVSEQRFALDIQFFPSGADGSKNVEVFCDAPLSAGTFTIPSELLADAVTQTGPVAGTPTSAQLFSFAGGQKMIPIKGALYIITVATDQSTTPAMSNLLIQ